MLVPLNFVRYPEVPEPVMLFVILGVTVTVCAVPPLGVTVKPFVPLAKVYVVLLSGTVTVPNEAPFLFFSVIVWSDMLKELAYVAR